MSEEIEKLPGKVKSAFAKVQHFFGFTTGYNFILFFIFGGAFFGFGLARAKYLNIEGTFCTPNNAAAGECFYYLDKGRYYIGIILHLGGVIPGSILCVFQFVPGIRHKFLWWHRTAGYIVLLLMFIGNAGALMICRRAFGGGLDIQVSSGAAVLMTTCGICLAYYNIKRLQIDQHRAWMLRSFVYFASIITNRLIFSIMMAIISSEGTYYQRWPCGKVDFALGGLNATLSKYPGCAAYYDGSSPDQHVPVKADFNGTEENTAASIGVGFGASFWLSLFLHALGVEIYLHLTPNEASRLRKVSYDRQLETGYNKPGNAGLTTQRLGDGPHEESA